MSTNQFGFLADETFAAKMDALTAMIGVVGANSNGQVRSTSWSQVQALVRAGLADKAFALGDQLVCKKGGENGTTLVWDVIGFDHDTPVDSGLTHSMTLQLHDLHGDYMQFDNREAFYYCSEVLYPGTYYFKIGAHPTLDTEVNKNYKFTTTVQIPAGGQIVFQNANNATFAGATIKTYASATDTTELEELTLSTGTTGNSLGTIDNTKQTNLNSIERALDGNNNYKESAIRQWLNSAAAAGSVWTPQNNWDRPPLWATTKQGWMNDLDSDFLAVVGLVTKTTTKNSVCDGGGTDATSEKFFLPSTDEVYITGSDASAAYAYYRVYSDNNSASTGADSNRIKYKGGTASDWCLRTARGTSGSETRAISTAGAQGYQRAAKESTGIAPVCNII